MAKVETVEGLYKTLGELIEQGHGKCPIYLVNDEEWNGLHPLYKGRFGCADTLTPDEVDAYGVPVHTVAIGTFY